MSDMELTEHITAFIEEREKRRENAREKAWEEVVDAIKNYCHNFEPIHIVTKYGGMVIYENSNFSKIGDIQGK